MGHSMKLIKVRNSYQLWKEPNHLNNKSLKLLTMTIKTIFNNFITGMLFVPAFMYIFGPFQGINLFLLICNLYKTYNVYGKKNILLITDFEENVNDYMLINLLVSLYKQKSINVSGIIINDDKTYEKAIRLRKYLRNLDIKDNEINISVSKDDTDSNEELENNLDHIYDSNIDLWDGYEMLLDCEKSQDLSIVCSADIKSLRKAVDNSECLDNISNIYIFNNITLKKELFCYKVIKTSDRKNEDLRYIGNEANSNKLPNNKFSVFCEIDTVGKVCLTNKDCLSVTMSNYIDVPDFAFIDGPLLLLYTVNPEVFETNTSKSSAIRCDNKSSDLIKNKLYRYIF
jgi:hypothetical protein